MTQLVLLVAAICNILIHLIRYDAYWLTEVQLRFAQLTCLGVHATGEHQLCKLVLYDCPIQDDAAGNQEHTWSSGLLSGSSVPSFLSTLYAPVLSMDFHSASVW